MPETPPKPSRSSWPWWVRFPLLGVHSRAVARFSFWICLLASVGCALYGFLRWPPVSIGGMLMLLGAWWYSRAIAWVDRAGAWA